MPNFCVALNATNTASATVPLVNMGATAAISPMWYEINSGSDASADNAVKYAIIRSTTRGTSATNATPIDISNTATGATAAATWDLTWNINPTVNTAKWVLQWAQHQRATYRWVAYDYTKMLASIVGANQGLALQSVVVSSAFNAVFSIEYSE